MSCNCNHKSAIQKYNNSSQTLTTTATAMAMGATATNTGTAFTDTGTGFSITRSGLYRITAKMIVTATVAGTVNVQINYNGVPLTDTVQSIPVAVETEEITIDTLHSLKAPCQCNASAGYPVTVVMSTASDTAAVNVVSMYVNALKEA